jgi:uncharacterized protein (TIGR02246 family)
MNDTERVGELFAELEAAWNVADGARFGRAFSDDGDFVNVRGELHRGIAAISAGHQGIFDTIYKGSTVRYEVISGEEICDGCVLGLASGTLEVPAGPLQGTHHSTLSVVMVRDDEWKVRAFQNTLVAG